MATKNPEPLEALDIDLDRDGFFRSMLRELAGTLTDVIGIEEAAGFVALVGQRIGEQLSASYGDALAQPLIAMGDGRCKVVVRLRPSADAAPASREYFGSDPEPSE